MAKEEIRAFGARGVSYFIWKRTSGSKGYFISRFNKHENSKTKIEISATSFKDILALSDSEAMLAAGKLFKIRVRREYDEERGIFSKKGKRKMYSEENERLAEQAYNRWLDAHPNDPTWEQFPNKHIWRDLVQTYQTKPNVRGGIPEMEQCVTRALAADAVSRLHAVMEAPEKAPEPIPEPVAEPVKPKPAKAKIGHSR